MIDGTLTSTRKETAMSETTIGSADLAPSVAAVKAIAQRVRWISTMIVDAANRGRPNPSGVKVGGHQSSSASMVEVMVALWFSALGPHDRVSVKPHASPALHAINYLLADLDESWLTTLRARGGLQSYPSRSKDPDTVDFSTGSVGIGATATIWAAIAHRYLRDHVIDTPPSGRYFALLGDAELDEGAIWEAVADPAVSTLGEIVWVVDLNRQSLDRVVPDSQTTRLESMFTAAGWQVKTCKWGRTIQRLFVEPGGEALRHRLESMSNEEYQRLLRADAHDVVDRLCAGQTDARLHALLSTLTAQEVAVAVRDLGGHDVELLMEAFDDIDPSRPTVIFAYTIKGRGLATEGHPSNHSALLNTAQIEQLAIESGTSLQDPWARFDDSTEMGQLCCAVADRLRRDSRKTAPLIDVPTSLPWGYGSTVSTQKVLGRLLADLTRHAPALAGRIVTCSPDVASSTNLGGWINKTGVWSIADRTDWFADDTDRLLRWRERPEGQHIELGIAETNLVGLLSELGATWSRLGEPLIPIGTIYDPFVGRALEPWSFGIYAGGQSILVGTPSGVTLASEGGAHQSISTAGIGVQQPACTAWEPAFAQDLEWCMLHAMSQIGAADGSSAYFRLTTRPIDQSIAQLPEGAEQLERRRSMCIRGGYRIEDSPQRADAITLVGVGAIMPEVLAAGQKLRQLGLDVGVVCLSSPDLVFRAMRSRDLEGDVESAAFLDELFPSEHRNAIVAVHDAHPHTLSFLAGVRGDRIALLGVTEFGQSSSLDEAYRLHGLDVESIVSSALRTVDRIDSAVAR